MWRNLPAVKQTAASSGIAETASIDFRCDEQSGPRCSPRGGRSKLRDVGYVRTLPLSFCLMTL